ncbi:MAG TPA: LysR family transcriptional regulator [Actinobacteria bacterium]|nr:LysR family transcriptional regulator [Actinomycetota bacterium]HCK78465.1 LysR family transcriptional regulator [Actinomycetota bacterium]
MSRCEDRLAALGLSLPPVATPLAAYVPAVQTGSLVFTAGQLPLVDGVIAYTGKVDVEVTVEQGYELARICVLNALAAVKAEIGDLDRITRVVRVVGYVASSPAFTGQPQVVNGASELLGELFGESAKHARSSVGMAVLPMDASVEIELIVEVE